MNPLPQVLLVTGGNDGHTSQKGTQILKPGANAWEWGPMLPHSRQALSGVNLNGVIYDSGGEEDGKIHDEVRRAIKLSTLTH